MAIQTRLTRLLGIEHPILSAPMAGIAGAALVKAVGDAGGLGLLGGGYGDAAWLDREIAAVGNSRFGVGFITWSLERQPGLLDQALAANPAAVMLSFGEESGFAPRVKQAGALLICQVQSVAQARRAADAGADDTIDSHRRLTHARKHTHTHTHAHAHDSCILNHRTTHSSQSTGTSLRSLERASPWKRRTSDSLQPPTHRP